MHVDDRRFHHIYEDRRDEGRYTVDRGSHVAFSGGPGGIRHDPGPEAAAAMHEQHVGRTSFQTQHLEAARTDQALLTAITTSGECGGGQAAGSSVTRDAE